MFCFWFFGFLLFIIYASLLLIVLLVIVVLSDLFWLLPYAFVMFVSDCVCFWWLFSASLFIVLMRLRLHFDVVKVNFCVVVSYLYWFVVCIMFALLICWFAMLLGRFAVCGLRCVLNCFTRSYVWVCCNLLFARFGGCWFDCFALCFVSFCVFGGFVLNLFWWVGFVVCLVLFVFVFNVLLYWFGGLFVVWGCCSVLLIGLLLVGFVSWWVGCLGVLLCVSIVGLC